MLGGLQNRLMKMLGGRGYSPPFGAQVAGLQQDRSGKVTRNKEIHDTLSNWYKDDKDHKLKCGWQRYADRAEDYMRGDQTPPNFPKDKAYLVFNIMSDMVDEWTGLNMDAEEETQFVVEETEPFTITGEMSDQLHRNWKVAMEWHEDVMDTADEIGEAYDTFAVRGVTGTKTYPSPDGQGFRHEAVNPDTLLVNKETRRSRWQDRTRIGQVRRIPLATARQANKEAQADNEYTEFVKAKEQDSYEDTTGKSVTLVEYEFLRKVKKYKRSEKSGEVKEELWEQEYAELDADAKRGYEEHTELVYWVVSIQPGDSTYTLYLNRATGLDRSMYDIVIAHRLKDSPWAKGLAGKMIEIQDGVNVALNTYMSSAFSANKNSWWLGPDAPAEAEKVLRDGGILRSHSKPEKLTPDILPAEFLQIFGILQGGAYTVAGVGTKPGQGTPKSGKDRIVMNQEILNATKKYIKRLQAWRADAKETFAHGLAAWETAPTWIPLNAEADEGEERLAMNVPEGEVQEGDAPFDPTIGRVRVSMKLDVNGEITKAQRKLDATELWGMKVLKDPLVVLQAFDWPAAAEIIAQQEEDEAMRAVYEVVRTNPQLNQLVSMELEKIRMGMEETNN